jgi:hypothetical protein
LNILNYDCLFNYKYYNYVNIKIRYPIYNSIIKEDYWSDKYLFYREIFIVISEQ